MRAIYDFSNKPGQTRERFLQNQWAKVYRRKFSSYREYKAAMEGRAVMDQQTQTFKFV